MLFQDPYSALNPRLKVGAAQSEPVLFYRRAATRAEADEDAVLLLEAVELECGFGQRYLQQAIFVAGIPIPAGIGLQLGAAKVRKPPEPCSWIAATQSPPASFFAPPTPPETPPAARALRVLPAADHP